MVYIASSSMTSVSRQSVLQIQSELSDAQTELASGVYADVGLTLGSSAGELVSLQQQQASLATYQTNNSLASDRKSTRLNSSHSGESRMPSSA